MSTRNTLDEKPTKAELERQVDDALKHTFPASDPITVGEPTAFIPDRPVDRQAPLTDTDLVNEVAANVEERHAKANSASQEQSHLNNKQASGGQRGGVVG
jgi:hypothetical protein